MANWSNPTNTTSYLDVLAELKARDVDALTMLETAGTNVPEHAIRFVRRTGANSEKIAIQERISGSWVTRVVEADSIDAGGSLGTMSTQNSNNVTITGGSIASSTLSGTISSARIPNLNASKINAGTLNANRIPNLAASKITSGAFGTARIPNLAASKITSGEFGTARIPSLSATKLTSGTLAYQRLPNSDNARSQLGLGSAAESDADDPLEAVNASPTQLNSGSNIVDDQFYATGITIPTSGQLLALRWKIGDFIQMAHFLRVDLLATTTRSEGQNVSGTRLQIGASGTNDGEPTLQRTIANEVLMLWGATPNVVVTEITLYKVRQALG